jgi:hypothetical protein
MDAFPHSRQGFDDGDLPLGPARPGGAGGAAGDEDEDELLPPFVPGDRAAGPLPAEADPPALADEPLPFEADPPALADAPPPLEVEPPVEEGGADAGDELPWLVTAAETAAAGGASPEGDEPRPEWAPHPAAEESRDASAAGEDDVPDWLELGGEADGEGVGAAPDDAPEGSAPAAGGAEGALALAERFESVARLLRARGVAGVLEDGSDDPLGLLLTGFALGYLQRDEADQR